MNATTLAARLTRYRVMAVITGTFLVVVFVGMLRYLPGVEVSAGVETALGFVAQAHGVIYIVYLVVSYMLWSAMPWKMSRLVVMALGGIVPLLSFILERRLAREVAASLSA